MGGEYRGVCVYVCVGACRCVCVQLACSCMVGIFSVGWADIYVMSAHINPSENTWETNRDTCARFPPAQSNKLLNGKAGWMDPKIEMGSKERGGGCPGTLGLKEKRENKCYCTFNTICILLFKNVNIIPQNKDQTPCCLAIC